MWTGVRLYSKNRAKTNRREQTFAKVEVNSVISLSVSLSIHSITPPPRPRPCLTCLGYTCLCLHDSHSVETMAICVQMRCNSKLCCVKAILCGNGSQRTPILPCSLNLFQTQPRRNQCVSRWNMHPSVLCGTLACFCPGTHTGNTSSPSPASLAAFLDFSSRSLIRSRRSE